MSEKTTPRELEALLTAYVEDACDEAQCRRMEELIGEDPVVLASYVDMMSMHAMLQWRYSAQPNEGGGRKAEGQREEFPVSVLPIIDFSGDQSPFVIDHSSHNAVGFFSQGMPLAYLVATIILGIALWTGSLIPVFHGVQLADKPSRQLPFLNEQQPVFVGQITGMVDCQWADNGTATIDRAHVPVGRRYALASGVMQITYDTGAKVILQGPCTYEVESATGGFLSMGKLTARLEKKEERRTENEELSGSNSSFLIPHSYFAVRTPTAVVTDLGTEFGVEVTQDGNTMSHVFRGSVSVQAAVIDGKPEGAAQVLRENESIHVAKSNDKRVMVIGASVKPVDFVRKLVRPTIKTFDLVDVVAGGDGFSKKRDRGINPTTGRIVQALRREVDPGGDLPIVGNGQLHRVAGMPFIDGVFVPNGAERPVQIDSAGNVSSAFQATANSTWQHIWAGGEIRDPKYPTTIGGIDYGSPGHGLLLLHANGAITFDLEAIRRANPGCKVLRFRAMAANTTDETFEGLDHRVDIWVLVDGQSRFQRRQINRSHGDFSVLVTVHDKDRFLTMVATDGGDGISGDWIVFGDPQLDLRTVEASGQNDRAE